MIGWMPRMVVGAMVLTGGCAFTDAQFERTIDLSAPHDAASGLAARTDNGSIEIERADEPGAAVRAVVRARTRERAERVEVRAVRGGEGWLVVDVAWPEGRREANEGCSLSVRTPGAAGVRAVTSNGRIVLRGLGGDAVAETSNGRVEIEDHAGSVRVATSNGGVRLSRVSGQVWVRTSNGPVEATGAGGAVDVESSNGGVAVALAPECPGPVNIRTSNGSVRLEVGPAFAGTLAARTSNGRLDLSGAAGAEVVRAGPEAAAARFGDGAVTSRVETSNGSVSVVAAVRPGPR